MDIIEFLHTGFFFLFFLQMVFWLRNKVYPHLSLYWQQKTFSLENAAWLCMILFGVIKPHANGWCTCNIKMGFYGGTAAMHFRVVFAFVARWLRQK